MVITRTRISLVLSLVLLAAFIAGIAWALESAEGRAGVGIYSLNVRRDHNGDVHIEAEFYHDGYIEDTRDETRRALGRRRYATFERGAAIFPDDYDDNGDNKLGFGQHNNHTDVDEDNVKNQQEHRWIRTESERLDAGEIANFTAWTYIQMRDVDHPSEWWVAAVTYSGYGSSDGAPAQRIKAVSEYNIDSDNPGFQCRRALYRESTEWGNNDVGRWSRWPW